MQPTLLKRKALLACIMALPIIAAAQDSSAVRPGRTRNIIWFTPNVAAKINGLAVGLQAMNLRDQKLRINGVNAGGGMAALIGVPCAIGDLLSPRKRKFPHFMEMDSSMADLYGASFSFGGEFFSKIRGLNIAGGITAANSIHGISVTGVYSKTFSFRGICVSGLMNIANTGRGLQIGLFNNCKDLKGLQLGLWNKSGKRGLPFVNWGA